MDSKSKLRLLADRKETGKGADGGSKQKHFIHMQILKCLRYAQAGLPFEDFAKILFEIATFENWVKDDKNYIILMGYYDAATSQRTAPTSEITPKSIEGTNSDQLTKEVEVGHGRAMPDVEKSYERDQPTSGPDGANRQEAQQRSGLESESFTPSFRSVFRRHSSEKREQRLLAEIEAYAQEFPENIEGFIAEAERRVEPMRPPKTKRTLNLSMASERSGLSVGHLSQLCSKKKLGGKVDGKPRFSEAELDKYVAQDLKPGPKPKGDESRDD